jgi:hypothetical protein
VPIEEEEEEEEEEFELSSGPPLESSALHLRVNDAFLPKPLAGQLRGTYDGHFANPRTTRAEDFCWNYWRVCGTHAHVSKTPKRRRLLTRAHVCACVRVRAGMCRGSTRCCARPRRTSSHPPSSGARRGSQHTHTRARNAPTHAPR